MTEETIQTRWISITVAVVALAGFSVMGYGCKVTQESWQTMQRECIASGGSFIPTATSNGSIAICLRGERK